MNFLHLENKAGIRKSPGQSTRPRILELPKGQQRCFCDIYPALEQERPDVARQLNLVKQAEILDSRKQELRIFYLIKARELLEIPDVREATLHDGVEENRGAVRLR